MIRHQAQIGVLASNKTYFIVLAKNTNIVIYLWRGLDSCFGTQGGLDLMQDTNFRSVETALNKQNRSGSLMV
jgi:hypothetical protein